MFFLKPAGHKLYNRPNPTTYDKSVGDFTKDNVWRDLDLSSIVPVGAVAIKISADIDGDAAAQIVQFRQKGATTDYNRQIGFTGTDGVKTNINGLVFCNSGRVIQYRSTANITLLNFTVCGWIK